MPKFITLLNVTQKQFWSAHMFMLMPLIRGLNSLLPCVVLDTMIRARIWAYLCPQLPNSITEDEEKLFIQLQDPTLVLKGGFHSKLSNRAKRIQLKKIKKKLLVMLVEHKIDPNSMIRLGKFRSRSVSLLKYAFMMRYDPLVQYLFRMGVTITPECYQFVMQKGTPYSIGLMVHYLSQLSSTIKDLLDPTRPLPRPTIELTEKKFDGKRIPGIKGTGIFEVVVDKFKFECRYTDPKRVVHKDTLESSAPFSSGYDDSRNIGWVNRQKKKICQWRVAVMIRGRQSPWSEWTESVTYLNSGKVRVLYQTRQPI